MNYCDGHQVNIAHKQMSSLGDQNYPSFELRAVLAYLTEQGNAPWCDQLLSGLGYSKHKLDQPFIPSHIALSALQQVITQFYKPGLGCHIGQTYCLSELGAIGACLSNTETLGEAMEISQTYHELIGSFTDIVNIVDADSFTNRLVDVSQLDPRLLQFLFELTVSGMLRTAEELSGHRVNVLTVRFSASLSDSETKFYSDLFCCPVEGDCKFNEWVIDSKSLIAPISKKLYSPEVTADNLKFLLYELNQEQGLVDNIDTILKCSGGDFPDPNMISSALGMSGRTMRRRLNNMGTSFSALIDKVRCQLAINLIQNQNLSNESLADELGYSDASNFYNAFKKWTGNPPSYYRIEN